MLFHIGSPIAKNMETVKFNAWLAKDENGLSHLFKTKPELIFSDALSEHYWAPTIGRMWVENSFCPGLKWDDEPIKVEITVKPL